MWLTFSTVAGGIYFHEFENANTFQWIALILGMMLNYFGLYHLVPTASDQPILIINMEKPPKKKVDDDEYDDDDEDQIDKKTKNKRKQIEHIKKNIVITCNKSYKSNNHKQHETENENEHNLKANMAPTDDDDDDNDDDSTNSSNLDQEDEQIPLINRSRSSSNKDDTKWYQLFVAKLN